ncbi:MAG: sulfatase [Elusimicrobia bacterium]|nr:sulfatase [Elusimicrobiota bacterium]
MMIRTAFLLGAIVLPSRPVMAQERPNIIMLDLCSTRADHFGTYGYARKTTPNMDALGKGGVVFENALSEGSWCLPSYASLLTGHVPEVHGLYTSLPPKGGLPKFETTLAVQLHKEGYRTALFSGGVYLRPEWGMTKGFDTYVNNFSTTTPGRVPAPFESNFDQLVNWLSKSRKAAPFFIFATIDDMHVPYHAHDTEKFDPGYEGIVHDTDVISVPFARAYNGEPSGYPEAMKGKVASFKSDPRNLQHLIAHYDAALSETDQRVGEFVAQLKKLGLDKNTVLIITADHGEMLGEKGLLNHTESLYEPVIHVPLIIKHPGFPQAAGRRVPQQVQRIDLMPTIMEMADAPTERLELQGRSLLPLLRDPETPWREYAFVRSKRNLASFTDLNIEERVVRAKCWKLHHYLYKDKFELYDLCSDPLETKDLSAERPELVGPLAFELVRNMEVSRPHQSGLPSGRVPRSLDLPLPPKY